MLDTIGMVVAAFLVTYKVNQIRLFEENFLVANITPEVVLEMLFLILSSADVDFLRLELWWRTYITKETSPTTRRIELVSKKKFATTALDPEYETYVIYVGSVNSVMSPSSFLLNVYFLYRSYIAGLIVEEAFTKISNKYIDFADISFPALASKLSKYTGISNHAMKLVDSQ